MSLRTRTSVVNTLPALFPGAFPGFGEVAPGALPPLPPQTGQQIRDLLVSPDFDAWSEALARVGNCARPIRLRGRSDTIDTATGEIVSSYSSEEEPLGLTHVRCGNRRASECPSCSRLYEADMFHLIRSGVIGGKTVPASVADNPLVFATLTAPSFGPVHGHRDHSRPCHPHRGSTIRCKHGRPTGCQTAHANDDPRLGQPLCSRCYDYPSQVVWQWWAPDLWRRFTIALRRVVAKSLQMPMSQLGEAATVQYAKVAEYQLRGVIHFHALMRLDGPRTADGFAPAPTTIDAEALAALVRQAAASVRLTVPGVDVTDPSRILAFGQQLDARSVRASRRTDDPDRTLSPEQVAGYLARYATKSATDTGASHSAHHRTMRATAFHLADRARVASNAYQAENPYALLDKWAHMLGFRGHFA